MIQISEVFAVIVELSIFVFYFGQKIDKVAYLNFLIAEE